LADRVLIGIPGSRVLDAALAAACESLAMPRPFLEAFRDGLPKAGSVHFGYERSGGALLYKVYLEFTDALSGTGSPRLLHLAYKWDARDPSRRALARYHWMPGLTTPEILDRLPPADGDLVRLAAERALEPLMYLEVREEGNPRASFDVNVHP